MCKNESNLFIPIDGTSGILTMYGSFLNEDSYLTNHSVLFHGMTGCGKNFFSKKCIEEVEKRFKTKSRKITVLDLIGSLYDTQYGAERKLIEIARIVQYELGGLGYKLKFNVDTELELFRLSLSKQIFDNDNTFLIRFPLIESISELERFYRFFHQDKVILYFITEKQDVVEYCKDQLSMKVTPFECSPLKQGDGKLLIKSFFSDIPDITFDSVAFESMIQLRPANRQMTVKQFISICRISLKYAKAHDIKIIDKSVMADAMTSIGKL